MYGKIVSKLVRTWCPKDVEMALLLPITYPVELHVDGTRLLLLDIVVCNPTGSGVIGLHGGCWLRIAHFLECSAQEFGFLSIVKTHHYQLPKLMLKQVS
jgi:hypothetical protein